MPTLGVERLDVETQAIAVVTLDAHATIDELAEFSSGVAHEAAVDAAPVYRTHQVVFSAPGGEVSDGQLGMIFARSRLHPRFDSIEGIVCTESPQDTRR